MSIVPFVINFLGEYNMVTYESLKQSAQYYRGERNYCGVIATAIALGLKFGKARSLLSRQGRPTGKGTPFEAFDEVFKQYGFGFMPYKLGKQYHLKNVAKRLPKDGIYLVYSRSHISCIRYGELQDWATDSGKRSKFCVKVVPVSDGEYYTNLYKAFLQSRG